MNITTKAFCTSLFMLWVAASSNAQLRMESLTVTDGLSQGFISFIIQDHTGFIWMATNDGLNRYDGYSIRRYTPKPFDPWALQTSQINCLYEDEQHLIWVGTDKGLYLFDPLKERFFHLAVPDLSLPDDEVSRIAGDGRGHIFVHIPTNKAPDALYLIKLPAGFATELHRNSDKWESLEVKRVPVEQSHNKHFVVMEFIGDSMLYAADRRRRAYRYDYASGVLRPFDPLTLPRSPTIDHNILWGSRVGYFFRWQKPDGQDAILETKNWARALRLKDGHVGVFLGHCSGVFKKNTNAPLTVDFGLTPGELNRQPEFQANFTVLNADDLDCSNRVMVDRQGLIWLGTKGYGARILNPRQFAFGNMLNGMSISTLRELPNDHIWVRLFDDRNFVFDPVSRQQVDPPWKVLKNRMIEEVFVDKGDNFWLIESTILGDTTDRKVVFYEKNTHKVTRSPQKLPFDYAPEKITQDLFGNIWVAAHRGALLRFKNGRPEAERFSYAHLWPEKQHKLQTIAIAADSNGKIWIGTNKGLICVEDPQATVPRFSLFRHDPGDAHSLSMDWVLSICPDPDNKNLLWIGTRGGGLNRFDTDSKQFDFWSEAPDGLSDNVVYGILPDATGNLWCSTNKGVCCFSKVQQTFVAYHESDGLLSTEFNTGAYLRTRDGRLWFGGVNGLDFFRPAVLMLKNQVPSVAITQIEVQGMPRTPDHEGELSLAHDENNVTFHFSVLDFASPKTNRYRYRLLGVNNDWIPLGTTHSANFSALPPGGYTFELQGATADSPWSTPPLQFYLEIRPPWYQSNLAWLFYAGLLLLLFVAYLRYRDNTFKLRHAAELSRQESERLLKFDGIKNKFFANIAHELRTPLTIILGLAERLNKNEKKEEPELVAAKIIKQSNDLLELTNQILDLGKLESHHLQLQPFLCNISDLIRQHAEPFAALANARGQHLLIKIDPPEIWMDADPLQMPKILNNLVSNAIRHTPSGGKILVETKLQNGETQLLLSVSDTGEGISPEDLPHVFERYYQAHAHAGALGTSGIGLTITRELVNMMGGSIDVKSVLGRGSVFTVLLPVTRQAAHTAEQPAVSVTPVLPPPFPATTPGNHDLPLLLIIEDNEDVCDYLRLCLSPYFKLQWAPDGQSGIQIAIQEVPDIVLTDVALPVKDGFEVTATLKKNVGTSHIPVVMLTAKTEQKDRLEGQRQGANAYLTKPFDERELLLTLQNLLQLQQQWKLRYARYPATAEVTGDLDPVDLKTEDAFVRQLFELFEMHYAEEDFDLKRLCHLLGMSRSQLDRKLKVLTDHSPMEMLRNFRLRKAYELLTTDTNARVTEVCFQTGFKNPSHFSRLFAKEYGVPPSEVAPPRTPV